MVRVVVEDIEADMYVAIDRATDRTGRAVVRKIGRQQSLLRQTPPPELKTEVSDLE